MLVTFGVIFITLLSATSWLSINPPAGAVVPPDSCFQFNSDTGAITDYYAYENDDLGLCGTSGITLQSLAIGTAGYAGSATIAIDGTNLTQITIPETVEFIGYNAFFGNQITELSIPSSNRRTCLCKVYPTDCHHKREP